MLDGELIVQNMLTTFINSITGKLTLVEKEIQPLLL